MTINVMMMPTSPDVNMRAFSCIRWMQEVLRTALGRAKKKSAKVSNLRLSGRAPSPKDKGCARGCAQGISRITGMIRGRRLVDFWM